MANTDRANPALTVKSRNSAYNYTRTLAAHRRGRALLHPKSLAAPQGLSGRAMLAPTIESQKSDIFLRKPCLLLVGACIAGPPMFRPAFGTPAVRLSGRKHFPIAKKDPQVYRLQVLSLGAPSGTLPRANQHRTVVLVAACGRPPCSRPWCKPKKSPRS